MPNNSVYTAEQIAEVEEREKKALIYLKENFLTPAASIQKVNIGNDVFANRLIPFLKDFKYEPKLSPIQNKDLPSKDEPLKTA